MSSNIIIIIIIILININIVYHKCIPIFAIIFCSALLIYSLSLSSSLFLVLPNHLDTCESDTFLSHHSKVSRWQRESAASTS